MLAFTRIGTTERFPLHLFAINFKINFVSLSNQAIYLHGQKVKTKIWVSWEELLIWNKKHFSSFMNGFHESKKKKKNWKVGARKQCKILINMFSIIQLYLLKNGFITDILKEAFLNCLEQLF